MTGLSTEKPLMLSFQELPWTNQLVVSSETKEREAKVFFNAFPILFSLLREICAVLYLNLANINLRLYHLAPFLKYRIHIKMFSVKNTCLSKTKTEMLLLVSK